MTRIIANAPNCPCCASTAWRTTEKACMKCGTKVNGNYQPSFLDQLSDDEMHFIKIFIHCEGKIKDIEKALGISYPSVKNSLSLIKEKLFNQQNPSNIEFKNTSEVLQAISGNQISYEHGLEIIKKLNKEK
jgi:hypothetical protein